MTFAEKLRKMMSELDIRQIDIANKTGSSRSSVSQWVSGSQTPYPNKQREIAIALSLPASYFDDMDRPLEPPPMGVTTGVVPRLTTVQVAKTMRLGRKSVEKGLVQGVFPWGYAILMGYDKEGKPKYNYYINKTKFEEIERVRIAT